MGDVFMSAVILSSRASNTPKKFNHFFHGAGHNVVNERNHGFGFETEETKVVSVSTETNFGFLLTETH